MPRNFIIRTFTWADLERFTILYNEVNGTVDTGRAADSAYMGQFLSHPATDAARNAFVAVDGEDLIGFILVFLEEPIARAVGNVGVSQTMGDHDIWIALLRSGIAHASNADVTVFHVQIPDEDSDKRTLLELEGFRHVRTYWDMRCDLGSVPRNDLPAGYRLRSFVLDQDEEALTEAQNAAFTGTWGFCPNTVEQIYRRVRYSTTDPDGIVLLEDRGRVIGYNWTSRAQVGDEIVGRVEMTGIHPDYRGKGLGKAVVLGGLQYVMDQGGTAMELEVDAGNPAASRLYTSLGFRVVRETAWHELPLG